MPAPTSAAEVAAAAGGYGSWTAGYLLDEASGNLAPAFGGSAPTLTASTAGTYEQAGPMAGDKAIAFAQTTQYDGGNNLNIADGADFAALFVVKFPTSSPQGYMLLSKGTGPFWRIYHTDFSTTGIVFLRGAGADANRTFTIVGNNQWQVIGVVIDRATNQLKVAVYGETSGLVSDPAAVDISAIGSLSNAGTVRLGRNPDHDAGAEMTLAALYIAQGANAATDMAANLGTIVEDFYAAYVAEGGAGAITGSGAGSASAQTGAGSGSVVAAGAGGGSATQETGSGAGAAVASGSGAGSAGAQTGSGVGASDVAGAGAGAAAQQTGAGAASAAVDGAGAGTSAVQRGAGAGAAVIAGSGAGAASAQTGAGSATVGDVWNGSGAGTASAQTGSGTGTVVASATGSGAAARQVGSGTGSAVISGAGAGAASAQTGSGSGGDATPDDPIAAPSNAVNSIGSSSPTTEIAASPATSSIGTSGPSSSLS